MKLVVCLAFLAVGAVAQSQTIQQQRATVHIYRTGSHSVSIQVLVDGREAFKVGDHEETSFALTPGHHEIGARYGHQEPTLGIDTRGGQEYFVQLSTTARHSALLGAVDPSNAATVILSRENGLPNTGGVHERPLPDDQLDYILYATARPQQRPHATAVEPASVPSLPPFQKRAATTKLDEPVQQPLALHKESFIAVQQAYRVKYAGGSLPDVQTGKLLQLRISPSAIELDTAILPSASITTISLSQDKHHRIGTGIAISVVSLGAGIPVMFSKSTKDFIQITWNDSGRTGGVAFQADKNEYRGILAALEGVTGKTATLVSEK
jgi:hypothetical protein